MSHTILYNADMEKTVYNAKTKQYVKKEFVAFCNSRRCTLPLKFKRMDQGEKWRLYDIFKFSKKDVAASCVSCPDCGSVLLWKPQE